MLQIRLFQALLLISTTALLIPAIPLADAASPTLKVTSSGIVATGSSVIINVKIAHFAPGCCSFDTFDITVQVNHAVLNPVGTALGPKVATWGVFIDCLNGGSGVFTLGCTINDGGGGVHVAATNVVPVFSHGPSVLFSITYTAVNGAPGTTSIIVTGTFFLSGTPIPHLTLNGTYS